MASMARKSKGAICGGSYITNLAYDLGVFYTLTTLTQRGNISWKNPPMTFLLRPPKKVLTIRHLLLHHPHPVSRPLCNTTLSFSIGCVMGITKAHRHVFPSTSVITVTREFHNDDINDEAGDDTDDAYNDDDDAPFDV
ncbi:conserved hypothetical protein [Ricinus communis]|uniref:Uncharacterized protein n=1 Tax=Ricinus communis TaxID=3988 RepID=B9SU92_RICCO|nr:conserved hypothetical protein [Ricinus communis]